MTGKEFTRNGIYKGYEVNGKHVRAAEDNRGHINGWFADNFRFY